ncbi:MAG: MFS transporter [Halioglobus sp.]
MPAKPVVGAAMMSACGSAVFLVLPMLVGQMIDYRGLNEGQAGLVASTYFATYLLSGASAFFWMNRVNWRTAGVVAYLLMVLGLLLAIFSENQLTLSMCFAVSGVGGGMLYALGVAVVSSTVDADRNFGWVLVAQQIVAAFLLLLIPPLITPLWDFAGTLSVLAIVAALLAISYRWIPLSRTVVSAPKDIVGSNNWPVRWALFAMLLHFTALSALWAFVDRLATHNGLSEEGIGSGLALSMFAGLAGALLVTRMAGHFGRKLPLWFAAGGFFAVCYGFHLEFGWGQFALLTALLSFVWNFVLAYQMGIVAGLDRDGRYAVLIPAAQACGAMLGPAAGGLIITTGGYSILLAFAAAGALVATLIFLRLSASS